MTKLNTTQLLVKPDHSANLLSDNSKFKKGMNAFQVSVWSTDPDSGKVKVRIRMIQIASFGKVCGTATCEENGEFLGVNIPPKISILAHTIQDAREMAKELGLYESRRSIAAHIRLKKIWLEECSSTARPEVVAKAREKLARLEAAAPSFSIIEKK